MGCFAKIKTTSLVAVTGWQLFSAVCVQAGETPEVTDAVPAEQYFDVYELRVLGNTRLPQREVETWLYQFLGPHKTLQDVEKARKTLETLYHDRGFGTVYVDVPEQRIESDGVVRLAVTEAKLRHVQVSGARYFSNREIKSAIPEAKAGTTPSLPVLQQQVYELNLQTNDRQVVPVLKAGSEPGTVDLNIKVDDHLPLHASVELNNQYSADTSPLRAAAGFSYDRLFGRMDSLAVQYQTSPQKPDEVKVWFGSYTTHLPDEITRLVLVYVDSDSAVATLGSGDTRVNVLGKGKTGSVRLIHPLGSAGNSLGALNLSIDYKNSLQNICSNTTDSTLCPFEKISEEKNPYHNDYTPINYLNFALGYSAGWRGEKQQGTVSLAGNFGVRGLRNDSRDFENKRYLANTNYIVFRSDGLWMLRLPADFNLQSRYSAQYAFDPLIANEQFSLTGADGVRSYLESEELIDRGIKATLQFGTPGWKPFKEVLSMDAYLFYDYGTGQIVEPLSYERASHSVAAWGAGFNFNLRQYLNGGLFWAHTLRDGANTRRGDSRYQFDVRASW